MKEAQKRLAFGFPRFEEKARLSSVSPWEWAVYALGHAHTDWDYAWQCFDQALKDQLPSGAIPLSGASIALDSASPLLEPPYHALILRQLFENAPNRERGLELLRRFFPKILEHQRYWYLHRDWEENGLIGIAHPSEAPLLLFFPLAEENENALKRHAGSRNGTLHSVAETTLPRRSGQVHSGRSYKVQDPYLNALICLSNAILLQMGQILQQPVPEILELQELTVFSANEKLWNPEYGIYSAYDMIAERQVLSGSLSAWMPLISAIPDQARAEAMRISLVANFLSDDYFLCPTQPIYSSYADFRTPGKGALHLWENWLLYQGMLQFDFHDLAHKIKKDTLDLVEEYGFHLFFNPKRSPVEHLGLDRGNETAAASIFLEFLQGAPYQWEE